MDSLQLEDIEQRHAEPIQLEFLYTDDTVIFCEAEQEKLCYIRVILVVIEACSRLKVNLRKSNVFPIKEVQ